MPCLHLLHKTSILLWIVQTDRYDWMHKQFIYTTGRFFHRFGSFNDWSHVSIQSVNFLSNGNYLFSFVSRYTWAQRHNATISNQEKIRSRSSFGSFLLINDSSDSENTRDIFQVEEEEEGWPLLEEEPFLKTFRSWILQSLLSFNSIQQLPFKLYILI